MNKYESNRDFLFAAWNTDTESKVLNHQRPAGKTDPAARSGRTTASDSLDVISQTPNPIKTSS